VGEGEGEVGVVVVRNNKMVKVETKNLLLLAKFGPGLHAKMKVNEGIWVICTAESMGRD